MMEKKVNVSGEFIQLNQLLKLENVVSSGGEAKALIESG
ncbi:MAG: RNA-binding S4 domain-containing protein, partial [Erysipelotrichaceae bacterium]|nr:RNA-binding S4 domain-containing protein [Erysipelotrichaceae bacterium]